MSYFSFSNWFIIGFERRQIPNENFTITVANTPKKKHDLILAALGLTVQNGYCDKVERKRSKEEGSPKL